MLCSRISCRAAPSIPGEGLAQAQRERAAMSEVHAISGMTRLRNYFLTGFVVCAPLAITAYITLMVGNLVRGL